MAHPSASEFQPSKGMTDKESTTRALRPGRAGSWGQRNFAAVVMCVQVLVDLCLVVSGCLIAWALREHFAPATSPTHLKIYFETFSISAAVCLLCFHYFGLYNPIKSLLNVKEFYGVTKACVTAFFMVSITLLFLRPTNVEADGPFRFLVFLHERVALHVDPNLISRVTLFLAFLLIFVFMMLGRFLSFRWIQNCHRKGIGHRNLLIIGAGSTGRNLQRKFLLMPTLGLNLVGFIDEEKDRVGAQVGRSKILGTPADLPELIEKYRIGEVIVAAARTTRRRRSKAFWNTWRNAGWSTPLFRASTAFSIPAVFMSPIWTRPPSFPGLGCRSRGCRRLANAAAISLFRRSSWS